MNIDFNAAFKAGMSEEDIRASIDKAIAEAKSQAEAELAKAKREQEGECEDKEALKAEGRAYLINAILCYVKAFDIDEEDWDQEDVDELEALLIKIEGMIPTYIELMEKQNELNDLGLGFGFGGFKM